MTTDSLHLFTSNIRPLYAQDAIDITAAPCGHVVRFRYGTKYVEPELHDAWANDGLRDRTAIVYFSLQQIAHYHPAAYLPLRRATIVGSGRTGSWLHISLQLADYACLPLGKPDDMGDAVRSFTSTLQGLLQSYPEKGRSATSGPDISEHLDGKSGEHQLWENLVTYLGRTASFESALFYRVQHVHAEGETAPCTFDVSGRLRLLAGRTYSVSLAQSQPREVTNVQQITIGVDGEIVQVIGPPQVEIASRYDTLSVRLHVPRQEAAKDTFIDIRPEGDASGPRLKIPVRVELPGRDQAARLGGSAAGAFLIGLPALMPDSTSTGWKALPLAAGTIVLTALAARRSKLL